MNKDLGIDVDADLGLFDPKVNDNVAKELGIDSETAPKKKRISRVKFDENTLMNPKWGLPYIHDHAASKLLGISKNFDGSLTKPRKRLDRKKLLSFYAFAAYKMAPGYHFEDFMEKARRVGSRASIRRLRNDWVQEEERTRVQSQMGRMEYQNDNATDALSNDTTQNTVNNESRPTKFASGFDPEDDDDDDEIFVSRSRARPRIQDNDDNIFVTQPVNRGFDSDDESGVDKDNETTEKNTSIPAPSSPIQFDYPLSEVNDIQSDIQPHGDTNKLPMPSSSPSQKPNDDIPFEFDLDLDDEEVFGSALDPEPTNNGLNKLQQSKSSENGSGQTAQKEQPNTNPFEMDMGEDLPNGEI